GDLHLTSAATGAIGKAKFLNEVSTDYDGQARSNSGTDVGADQYQAVVQPQASAPGDAQSPTVAVTGPTAGSTVSGTVPVTASASDTVGATGSQFSLDGKARGGLDPAAPYSANLDTTTLSNGSHTLTATASDAAGNTTTSAAVSFTVNNSQ